MALKLTVDSLDGMDEAIKSLYVERNGKFSLAVEGADEDQMALTKALENSRRVEKELKRKVDRWEKLGRTDEEIQQLLIAQARDDEDRAAKSGEWDKIRNQMNESHTRALKQKDETISAMRRRLESELVDAKAVAAIAAAKGAPDLLLPHVQRHIKVDDDFNVMVVDAKGDPRVNNKGEPLSIADLVNEMRETEIYGRAFDGVGQSGSATRPANGAGRSGSIKRRSDLKTREDRVAFVQKYGNEAYLALPY